jgi:hypothetical protein
MLTRFHKILIAILAVQLLLIVVVMTRSDDSAALKEHPIVAGFDAAKVTRVQVFSGQAAQPIDLVKRDASWVLASGFDYPVEEAKLTDLLSPIAKLTAAAPIATQASRHPQLHVADADFERKLVITQGGKDVTLYIGSAVGARRVAVRLGGDDKVFGVLGISTAAAGNEPGQWVAASYVKLTNEEIAKVSIQRDATTVELVRPAAPPSPAAGSGSGAGSMAPPSPAPLAKPWDVTVRGAPITLATGESVDDAAIDRLIGQVATIDLRSPADPKRDAAKPTATITIERKASGTATPAPVILDVIADGDAYWVHDRSLPRAVLVDKARIDDVVSVDRDKLVKKPPPQPSVTPPGAGSGSAPRPAGGTALRPG